MKLILLVPVNRTMADSSKGVRTFELVCTDCAFTTTFEGDIDGLYDVIEGHQDRMRNSPADHSVDFEAVSSSVVPNAGD